MLDGLIELVRENGLENVYSVLIITLLRPFGLSYGFVAFTWALRNTQTLRVSIAIALALPTWAIHVPQIETLIGAPDITVLAPVALKEFGIGFALGFLASLPFFALQYAGAITDAFRGENDTGLLDPTGGMIHTFSLAYVIIGFFAFFSMNGLGELVRNLYLSYAVWPVNAVFPTLDETAIDTAAEMLMQTLRMAAQIALPLLGLLVVIEFGVSIAARLARRFNFYDMAFPLRNIAALLSLPLSMMLVWAMTETTVAESGGALVLLRAFFE